MKSGKLFFLFALCALSLVGCEDNNGVEGYNLLNEEQEKKFSVSSYIYESKYNLSSIDDPTFIIQFADSFRCKATYWLSNTNHGSFDYYYDMEYPYISIYYTYLYGWKHDEEGNFVVDYFTKDELKIEGLAGVLRFTKDTSVIVVDKSYCDFEFFNQETPMELHLFDRVEDPNSLFPIPDLY